MAVLRKLARPMLASIFVSGGYGTLRHPEAVAPAAEPVAMPVAEKVSGLPRDTHQLVRINSAVQIGAGALLAVGRLPRASALALAVTLVPTTLAGHPYWTIEDPEERRMQRIHFFKNLSMMGGLLIAAADTHGKPSAAYRTRQGAHRTADTASQRVHAATDGLRSAADTAMDGVRRHLPVG